MSSRKKSSTPTSSAEKAAAVAPAKSAKTAKTATKAQTAKANVIMAEAAPPADTIVTPAAPAAPAEVTPSAAPVSAESSIELRDDLVARVARAIARMDPQCPLSPDEVKDDLQVDLNGAYARMARAALLAQ